MRLEWAWAIPVMSLLLNPQTPSSRSTWESRAQKPPDSPESPQLPGAVTQTGPTDCLSYRIEESPQTGTTTVTCIFGGGGGFTFPYGGGGGGGGGTTSPGGGGGGSTQPGMPLSPAVSQAVGAAVQLANEKLADPNCAALFSANPSPFPGTPAFPSPWNSGTFILNEWILGYRSGEGMSNGICSGPYAAWVTMSNHARYVMICDSFLTMTPGERAAKIIHETLHIAGLKENPPDPAAPTTQQIDQTVRQACGT